jgi:hypothetical protein
VCGCDAGVQFVMEYCVVPHARHSFHVIFDLPRPGSMRTAAMLRRNPRFHAGTSSPIASLFDGVIAQVSAGSELSNTVNEEQRAFWRGLERARPLRIVRPGGEKQCETMPAPQAIGPEAAR